MRQLVLLRGGMGAGKSTWVEKMGLEQYTLCADNIRLLHQSPVLTPEGGESITMNNDNAVWKTLRSLLRERMKRGEFTVIDATHSKVKDINAYRELATEFRYRVTIVDFTDVPIGTAIVQNNMRPVYKRVPLEAIERFYKRIETEKVPSWVNVIKPHEFKDKMNYFPTNYSQYKKIHHIGDVHGCNTALQKYLQNGLKDDELYIFLGDYIDRGIENAEVLEFLFSIMDKENVILLEGNHEKWLWRWANGEETPSKEFNKYTMPELEEKGIDKKRARMFYRKLRQIVFYDYVTNHIGHVRVLVTHGGVGHIPSNLLYVATEQFINGVGGYEVDIDQHFADNMKNRIEVRGGIGNSLLYAYNSNPKLYQIHGHRNLMGHETWATDNSFNLEGGIERGNQLRAVQLSKDGFVCYDIDNPVFSERQLPKKVGSDTTVEELLELLQNNRYIREAKMKDNISSFNFTSQAFFKGVWNGQTMRARGLFINTKTKKIVARSYDKFFNVGERPETTIEEMKENLEFPVVVRHKPNGYLGILGYNHEKDELVFASKSSTKSEHAKWFKEIFDDTFSDEKKEIIKDTLRVNDMTMTFEVIDPINDSHIIKYENRKIILLDMIYNTPNFDKRPYEHVSVVAKALEVEFAEKAITFYNWKDFFTWYQDIDDDYSIILEGYVIEDCNGFMTKLKLPYYLFWKKMRSLKDKVTSGKEVESWMLDTDRARSFYGFIKFQKKDELSSKDIITLREEYYQILK